MREVWIDALRIVLDKVPRDILLDCVCWIRNKSARSVVAHESYRVLETVSGGNDTIVIGHVQNEGVEGYRPDQEEA